MTNQFRVDRVSVVSKVVPCGMNSILHIGDNLSKARAAFMRSTTAINTWGKPNTEYGVALSRWDSNKRDYVRIGFKDSAGSIFMECK